MNLLLLLTPLVSQQVVTSLSVPVWVRPQMRLLISRDVVLESGLKSVFLLTWTCLGLGHWSCQIRLLDSPVSVFILFRTLAIIDSKE